MNAATEAEQHSMTFIEAKLSDFIDGIYSASPDFCFGYWQGPLDLLSYDACGIFAPQGNFVLSRVLPELKRVFACFQSTVPL